MDEASAHTEASDVGGQSFVVPLGVGGGLLGLLLLVLVLRSVLRRRRLPALPDQQAVPEAPAGEARSEAVVPAPAVAVPEEPTPESRARLGDLLLLARNDSRLVAQKEPVPFHGHHGSLTPEEMLVPLLMVRLDRL